jgi:hypothetical protein
MPPKGKKPGKATNGAFVRPRAQPPQKVKPSGMTDEEWQAISHPCQVRHTRKEQIPKLNKFLNMNNSLIILKRPKTDQINLIYREKTKTTESLHRTF